MEKVSFKVAKAIKEAGYPQDENEERKMSGLPEQIDTPFYLEVWLWLWKEKKKDIDITFSADEGGWTFMQNPSPCDCGLYDDPEEAIIAAIDYLVDNNLIK